MIPAPGPTAGALSALLLMAALPRTFFRRGRLGLRWWLTASPFIVQGVTLAAGALGALEPAWGKTPLAAALLGWAAVVVATVSVALMGLAVGSHRSPVSLWHQEDDQPAGLVTAGAYGRIRHPFYAAFLLALLAGALALPHPLTLGALAGGLVALDRTAAREEGRLLGSPMGDAYRAYMGRTGRFWPVPGPRPAR